MQHEHIRTYNIKMDEEMPRITEREHENQHSDSLVDNRSENEQAAELEREIGLPQPQKQEFMTFSRQLDEMKGQQSGSRQRGGSPQGQMVSITDSNLLTDSKMKGSGDKGNELGVEMKSKYVHKEGQREPHLDNSASEHSPSNRGSNCWDNYEEEKIVFSKNEGKGIAKRNEGINPRKEATG
jgi:hypothetical protein